MSIKYRPEPLNEFSLEWIIRELNRISYAFDKMDGLWDDLRFPATSINLPGSGSPPGVDTTYGGTYLFNASSTEYLFAVAQLPHAWKVGTTLRPHIHWEKTTSASGDVYWRLEYEWHKIGEVAGSTQTLNATTVADGTPDDDTANKQLITSLGDITTSGVDISDVLTMKISRIGGDAADTYGADARFIEFDIHIQTDQNGSEKQFIKDTR